MSHFNFFQRLGIRSVLVRAATLATLFATSAFFSASGSAVIANSVMESWPIKADEFWRRQYFAGCAQHLKDRESKDLQKTFETRSRSLSLFSPLNTVNPPTSISTTIITQKVETFHARDCRVIKKNTSCVFLPSACSQILEKRLSPLRYESSYLLLIPEPWYVYASNAALACRKIRTGPFTCDYVGVIRNRVETHLFYQPPFTFGISHKAALRYAFNPEAHPQTRNLIKEINTTAQNAQISFAQKKQIVDRLNKQINTLFNSGIKEEQQRHLESEMYYARRAIIDFYKRYQITLDLELVMGWPNRTPQLLNEKGLKWDAQLFPREKKLYDPNETYDQFVNVFFDEDTSKADEWHLKGLNYTKTATHEISHKFGLQDEYAAAEYCPLYAARESNSLMAASYYSEVLTDKHLYLRHFQEIFKYLCDSNCEDQKSLEYCQDYQRRK